MNAFILQKCKCYGAGGSVAEWSGELIIKYHQAVQEIEGLSPAIYPTFLDKLNWLEIQF